LILEVDGQFDMNDPLKLTAIVVGLEKLRISFIALRFHGSFFDPNVCLTNG